jgi:Domain of unknown function (DUF4263)
MADTMAKTDEERLYLVAETPERLRVDFQPSRQAWEFGHPQHKGELPRRPLVRFDTSTQTVHTYPLKTGPSLSTLGPKYGPVSEIAFEGFPFALPKAENEVEEQLYQLPEEFYPQPAFGLGIRRHVRPVIDVIARNHFRRLVISRTRNTALDKPSLILSEGDFEAIAFELGRIADRFSDQSRAERTRHAYNGLLAEHFPDEFKRDERPYRKGMLVSFLRRTKTAGNLISSADREALVMRTAEEAPALARHNPRQLYKLQRDIEIAGLNQLITKFEVDVAASHPESFWQRVFKLNPFILSMLFGYPIVLVRDQAHVGGQTLDGSGDTIVDFLLKNESTSSLAIVEIKTPDTALLGGEFRPGRFKPSPDLNAAVIQVVDQRYELLVNYKDRAKEAGTAHAVDCVVVAGRKPTDAQRLASFEMYRTSLKDVRVYTFDELLLKLRALRDYLVPPPPAPTRWERKGDIANADLAKVDDENVPF